MSNPASKGRLTLVGIESATFTCGASAPFIFYWSSQLPRLAAGGGQSSAVFTITNTTKSTTLYTGVAGATGGSVSANCSSGDLITFANSSAAAADQGLNAIQTTISFSEGVS